MNETSILHLAGGKVTLQARRAVHQSKNPANGKFVYRDNIDGQLYVPQAEKPLRPWTNKGPPSSGFKLRPRA
jgi:hypothetical protein